MILVILTALITGTDPYSYGANCQCSKTQLREAWKVELGPVRSTTSVVTPQKCKKQGRRTIIKFKDHHIFRHHKTVQLQNLGSRIGCNLQYMNKKWVKCGSHSDSSCTLTGVYFENTKDVNIRATCSEGETLCPVIFINYGQIKSKVLPDVSIFPFYSRINEETLSKRMGSCELHQIKIYGKVTDRKLKISKDTVNMCGGECGKGFRCIGTDIRIVDRLEYTLDSTHRPIIVEDYMEMRKCGCVRRN